MKKPSLKVALDLQKILESFAEYGILPESNQEVSEVILDSSSKCIYELYGEKNFTGSLDELRCHLLKTKNPTFNPYRQFQMTFPAPPEGLVSYTHLEKSYYPCHLQHLSLPPPAELGRDADILAIRVTKSPTPNIPSNKNNSQKDKSIALPIRNSMATSPRKISIQ